MRIKLIAVGRLKTGPERDIAQRYETRLNALGRAIALTGFEREELEESRARRSEERKAEEAHRIRASLPPMGKRVFLDERGVHLNSSAFAQKIGDWRDQGSPCCAFVIGGPDGLDEALRAEADVLLALGTMTWPHQIVRLLLAEQLYRAASILAGHPYHRI